MRALGSGLLVPDDLAPAPPPPGRDPHVSGYRWERMSREERRDALKLGWRSPTIGGGSARTYALYNGATAALTAAMPKVATGTSIKTLLQAATPSTAGLRVIEWALQLDAPASSPVQAELLETDVAATVTAYNAGDVVKMNGPNDEASVITLGTTASGFTSTSEGSITATRLGDYQLVAQAYVKQFPLGREFEVRVSKFLRIRVTAAVSAGAVCYLVFEQ